MNEAQLKKRSKELDAQEEYIAELKGELDNAPMTIKVYEAQVQAKQEQLSALNADIDSATEHFEDSKREQSSKIALIKGHAEALEAGIIELTEQKQNLNADIKELRAQVKQSKTDIAEQEAYLKQTIEQIDQSIAVGNDKLLDLKDDIGKAEFEINELSVRRVELKTEVDELILNNLTIEDNCRSRHTDMEAELSTLQANIEIARNSLAEELKKQRGIFDEADRKLAYLTEKEESIIAKRDALALERQEFDTEKRRFSNSRASLYEM